MHAVTSTLGPSSTEFYNYLTKMSKVIELAKEAESKIRSADENWTSTKTKFRSATIEGLEWSYKGSKRTILETA